MKTIDWKGQYINYNGEDISAIAQYLSISARSVGVGTRIDPFPKIKNIAANQNLIIGGGNFEITSTLVGVNLNVCIVGNQRELSVTDNFIFVSGGTSQNQQVSYARYLSNLTVKKLVSTPNSGGTLLPHVAMDNCILDNLESTHKYGTNLLGNSSSSYLIKNSIQKGRAYVLSATSFIYANQCTFKDISGNQEYYIIRTGQALIIDTAIRIDQNMLTNNYTYYTAFNNCKFLIGSETSATALVGNTADELRANFVSRSEAQGLTVPMVTEYESTVLVGRWVFSKTSIVGEYDTLHDSEIDRFAKQRGIYFGHTNQTIDQIPITTTLNIPASFSTQTPVKDALVQDNSIGLLAGSDITTRLEAYADSKIIWLGGLRKLTTLSLTHNLPTNAGVAPDSVLGLAKVATPSGSIESGVHYIIRSGDDGLSAVKYNNVEYSSSLITRNNVFLGVNGVNTFTATQGNPQVYQVLDFANHHSFQIRLMREIPFGNITSGNLQAGYWYFVEPDNLNDASGSVTYKGIVRPAFDSFLVDNSDTAFTINGSCHLRRCWKQDFDYNNEFVDAEFWTDRQKPYYFDVVSDDLRCLLKNHSSASVELQKDANGLYIGSGHPEFYNSVNGANGIKLPAYDIVGSFLQIRIPITTLNVM